MENDPVLKVKRQGRLLLPCAPATGPLDGVVFSFSGGVLPLFCAFRSGIPGGGVPVGWLPFLGALGSGTPGAGVPPGGGGLELAFGEVDELALLLFWQVTAKANATRTIK